MRLWSRCRPSSKPGFASIPNNGCGPTAVGVRSKQSPHQCEAGPEPIMNTQRTPQGFYKPLAIGAPDPYRALPVHLERMIHFIPPHIDKITAKLPAIIPTVDIVLGNLDDA